ncbi:ATPase SWSAP1 [Sorex araneus]|uniref:ATPase SWSAP1 n=1 Tax=Sorex araneus TaxID=42254 RepID=UPI0024337AF5|nr:ATPase SWSAP1 [Sorex araneus]
MAETLRRVLSATRPVEDNVAEAGSPLLLLGGPGSGKTTLLFAAALEAAGEGRGPVLFLTRRPLQSLPRRAGAELDPLRLQKIRFQYPPSIQELLWLLCSAHEIRGPAPSLLLLDGLEEYLLEDPGTQDAAYLVALLLDTAAHFSHRVHGGCGLMVALQTQEEGDRGDVLQLSMIQRYFPAQCWLHADAPDAGQGCLRVSLEPGGLSPRQEWSVIFHSDGEMTVIPRLDETGDPRTDSGSSTGDQPCASVCETCAMPQFPQAKRLTPGTHAHPKP